MGPIVIRNPKRYKEPPCIACGAQCCRYVAIEIDKPTNKRDFENIRWYLLHENVYVFIDHDNVWHVEFRTKCRALGEDQRCHEYDTRPQLCRDHGLPVGSCEFFDSPYKHRFTQPEEFERYLDKKKIDWRYKRRPRVET